MKKLFLISLISCLLFSVYVKADINPIEELTNWTVEQNLGITIAKCKDVDWKPAYYWKIFETKNQWLTSGTFVKGNNQFADKIGIAVGFNAGKLINKIKGKPLTYLNHLEIGYYQILYNVVDVKENESDLESGIFINVIKLEW